MRWGGDHRRSEEKLVLPFTRRRDVIHQSGCQKHLPESVTRLCYGERGLRANRLSGNLVIRIDISSPFPFPFFFSKLDAIVCVTSFELTFRVQFFRSADDRMDQRCRRGLLGDVMQGFARVVKHVVLFLRSFGAHSREFWCISSQSFRDVSSISVPRRKPAAALFATAALALLPLQLLVHLSLSDGEDSTFHPQLPQLSDSATFRRPFPQRPPHQLPPPPSHTRQLVTNLSL